MFYTNTPFYYATIRKYIHAFGACFTNLIVTRYSDAGGQGTVLKNIKVPVNYGSGSSWMKLREEWTRSGDKVRLQTLLPRVTFEVSNISYDANRKLITTNANGGYRQGMDIITYLKQRNSVPYDLTINLYVTTKTIDDNLQIIEQILPNFTPSFNITVDEIPELNFTKDASITLQSVQFSDDWQGEFTNSQFVTTTIVFSINANLYPAITDSNIIKEVIAKIKAKNNISDESDLIITTRVDPIDTSVDDFDPETDVEVIIEP